MYPQATRGMLLFGAPPSPQYVFNRLDCIFWTVPQETSIYSILPVKERDGATAKLRTYRLCVQIYWEAFTIDAN